MSTPAPILQYCLSEATVKQLLPVGYTPLAYIESSGTQWINSGITLNSSTSTYQITCKVGASTRDSHAHSFFGTSSYLTGLMGIYHYTNNNYYSEYILNANKGTWNLVIPKGNIFEYYLRINMSAKTYASRIAYASEVTGSFTAMSNTSDTIRVFKSDDYPGGYWKCYYFRITKDNVLQVDLVPCIQDSNGVIGMYDLVSRSFKANSGSGTFIAGPPLAIGKYCGKSLPEEYLQVEYLHFKAGEALSTGVAVSANQQVIMKLGLKYDEGTSGRDLYGWSGSAGGYTGVTAAGAWEDHGTVNKLTSDIYKHNNITWTLSDGYAGTIWLCGLGGNTYNPRGKCISYCNISVAGILKIDWWACYRKSDMMPGFYDTLSGTFTATSNLGLGPSITNCYTWEPNASGKVALNPYDTTIYTESDGSRWMRIFHHNNPTNSKFASSVNLSNNVYESADKWSCILMINKNLGNWELMLKQKDTSSSSEVKYRWIQYYNPYSATWAQVQPGQVRNVSGYSGTMGGMWAMNSSDTYFVIANTSSSNWFGAIGAKTAYNGGIPGYPNTTCTSGYMDLYVRIDDNASFEPIGLYNNVSCAYDSTRGWSGYFKASNQTGFLSIPAQPLLTNCTVAFWAKLDTNKSWLCLGSVDNSYYLGASSSGTGGFYHAKVGSSVSCYVDGVAKSAPYGDTNWHFYCFTGVNLSSWPIIYLNNYTGPNGESNDYYGWNINGCYQNFMIFNTALTAAQVKELYGQ